ncbi:MAG: hypothetical protein HY662_03100 [Chloroflexi bacterium]|nr:hypothetical protein [Chloroflexota bacterium]
MSKEALKGFQEAQVDQTNRNQARNIWYHVHQARGAHVASVRWPFELFQNALDAGPRADRSSVDISISRRDSALVFEHDGAPFSYKDLAALLSGGSNKELESADTTGRFGTGYLVTHVLSERVHLIGLLQVGNGVEQFDLNLDRGGDENAILQNMKLCGDSITAAKAIPDGREMQSGTFEYPIDNAGSVDTGLTALRQALPYIYATRPKLGQVMIKAKAGTEEVWKPGQIESVAVDGGWLEYRSLQVQKEGNTLPERRICKFMTGQEAASSVLVLLELTELGWQVLIPDQPARRVYREYPLSGSDFLPINLVLDGKFDPDEQRRAPKMTDQDKALLKDALEAGVLAVRYASDQKLRNAHLLARAECPATTFTPDDVAEMQWWKEQLGVFAQALARLPIVECAKGALPAVTDNGDSYADFVMPRLLPDSSEDETTVERMWPVLSECTELYPPKKQLAEDWTTIAKGWQTLGVKVNLISVKDLADWVRDEATNLDELKVRDDKKEWLAAFLDIVGECWTKRKGIKPEILEGILPNQNQNLCSPTKLFRDISISEPLKAICSDAGYNVRDRLFIGGLDDIAQKGALEYFSAALIGAVTGTLSEDQVIEELVKHLSVKFPDNKPLTEDSGTIQKASVQLLSHLWTTKGETATLIARRVPLITAEQRAVQWTQTQRMMAPVRNWHQSARPFAGAYPEQRILDDLYLGSEDGKIPNVVTALVDWGIAFPDPLIQDKPPSGLTPQRLSVLGIGDVKGVTVNNVGNQSFSQIALLQPDVLNRCQEGADEARSLLGLVLCYLAPNDNAWRETRIVKGRRGGQDVEVTVTGALWLADLRIRAWVPVPDEDDKTTKMIANRATLERLGIDSKWLSGNDAAIELLSTRFEFDELELRLLSTTADKTKSLQIRNGLAKLVEIGGPNPEFFTSLVDQVKEQRRRSRDVEKCRKLGLAVQEAVAAAMDKLGLKLKLIDREFDYEVVMESSGSIEDAATRLNFGPYLLEVKATTTGGARMTPPQAKRASADAVRYVLSVVDLRGLSEDELGDEWTAARVEPLAKIVTDIGHKTKETCSLIQDATTKSVGIRNESALRYEVPKSVWESGISISAWVNSISRSGGQGPTTNIIS